MGKRVALWVATSFLVLASAAQAASGDGLQMRVDSQAWEGLKGRLMLGASAPTRKEVDGVKGFDNDAPSANNLSVMGDYYFRRPWLGLSGLRATSGLMLGARTSLWGAPASGDRYVGSVAYPEGVADNNATLPYLGVGYSGLSSKGWGVSADIGLMALNPRSAVRFGSQSLDDTLRDLRFSPLLQLGVSYSF